MKSLASAAGIDLMYLKAFLKGRTLNNIVSYLLRNFRNDININAQNKKGQTALHFSHYYRFSNITRILLKQGANGTIQNSYGLTYLEGLSDRFRCK